ncbi:hypothetical protein HDU80_004774 [Chytriomyces hyalinus]|nr:hypothetical protein HDU80_004774 [Chytriomyces hyalinus]
MSMVCLAMGAGEEGSEEKAMNLVSILLQIVYTIHPRGSRGRNRRKTRQRHLWGCLDFEVSAPLGIISFQQKEEKKMATLQYSTTKFEAAVAEIEAVNKEIKDTKAAWNDLKKKARRGALSTDEQIDLESFDEKVADLSATLADLKKNKDSWIDLICIQTNGDFVPESKPFKEADAEWTKSVTGINTDYRMWAVALDDDIRPTEAFKAQFEDIAKFVHMKNEGGRRFFLNLFLLDIVKRAEFNGALKIFPEIPMEVTQLIGTKKRKLSGTEVYTVGLNSKRLDTFDIAPPKELHLIAIEAKVDWGTQDFWQCVAETATLYKARKDAGKTKCSVWGVLSNAKLWQFVFINEDGILSQTEEFSLNLHVYDEEKIAKRHELTIQSLQRTIQSLQQQMLDEANSYRKLLQMKPLSSVDSPFIAPLKTRVSTSTTVCPSIEAAPSVPAMCSRPILESMPPEILDRIAMFVGRDILRLCHAVRYYKYISQAMFDYGREVKTHDGEPRVINEVDFWPYLYLRLPSAEEPFERTPPVAISHLHALQNYSNIIARHGGHAMIDDLSGMETILGALPDNLEVLVHHAKPSAGTDDFFGAMYKTKKNIWELSLEDDYFERCEIDSAEMTAKWLVKLPIHRLVLVSYMSIPTEILDVLHLMPLLDSLHVV